MQKNLSGGGKYFLPKEAAKKRRCEEVLADVFFKAGYEEVIAPVVDQAETMEMDPGTAPYRVMDPTGQMLVLRPDWTTPMAHLAAVRLQQVPRPLRLCYRGSVFREEEGRRQEFYQSGLEILGAPGDLADGEVVSLAAQCLSALGLDDFRIGLGQVKLVDGLMSTFGLAETESKTLQDHLGRRDFVSYREALRNMQVEETEKDLLRRLPGLHGGEDILKELSGIPLESEAQSAMNTLTHVYSDLEAAGLSEHIYLDLGMTRDMKYYTGIVFEGYTKGLGRPVLGGGRYDQLARRFGADLPATGFAVYMERLITALERQGWDYNVSRPDYLVIPAAKRERQAVEKTDELRKRGKKVLLEVNDLSYRKALEYAREKGCRYVLTEDENGWRKEKVEARKGEANAFDSFFGI